MDKGKEKVFEENDICLVMIVQDESQIIERALSSVVNIISSYLICDTGSEDDTVSIIEKFMSKHHIPGQTIFKKWENSGFNKNYLLEEAYNLCVGARYIIWLDANEVFLNERKEYLTCVDKKKLLQFADSKPDVGIFYIDAYREKLQYKRQNMIRNNQLFHWESSVYEYLVPSKPTKSAHIKSITLLSRKEETKKICKRNIEVFEEYLKEKPDDSRAYFYLAQTYNNLNQAKKAIEFYLKCMDMEGSNQERYVTALQAGRLLRKLGRHKEAIEIWRKGQLLVPTRIEIPFELMMLLNKTGKQSEAYEIGIQAYHTFKYDPSDFSTEKGKYDWHFFMEFSVIAYYTGHHQVAHEVGEKLLLERKFPKDNANQIELNMQFFQNKVCENHLNIC